MIQKQAIILLFKCLLFIMQGQVKSFYSIEDYRISHKKLSAEVHEYVEYLKELKL